MVAIGDTLFVVSHVDNDEREANAIALCLDLPSAQRAAQAQRNAQLDELGEPHEPLKWTLLRGFDTHMAAPNDWEYFSIERMTVQ